VITEAAVLWGRGEPWSVEAVELDEPGPGEVLVRVRAAGLCHSDDHLRTGGLPSALPIIGGHEGAGVVERVGDGVTSVDEGDHVVFGFIPACGRCPACSTGHQSQCDVGAVMGSGLQLRDQTARHHARGRDLALMCLLGTFARHTVVAEAQCVRIAPDVPFEVACLTSCAVITGYGSTIYAGGVQPGDDVTVIGVGGVGVNAVQAARIAGARQIFAVDPVPSKRERATNYGATHVAASIDEAYELIRSETGKRMSNRVIVTMDVARGDLLHPILRLTAKLGRVVLVSLAAAGPQPVTINLFDLTMREKQLVGSLSGSGNPHHDIPKLLGLYKAGLLDLDSQISASYPLEKINEGYADLTSGDNLRGVLVL
jgi:S-(hydroxymethyl)glutathione dehydrogenase/alcohol dehydrogenase